ncbi:MAG TPA: Gfo/Idh/MocA family oxidoreductase [Bacilli bacterium]|nr:Gfo/Idh/MocA family oxidoreductase [Bacilli bacterium]
MQKKIKLGIIGAGKIASVISNALLEEPMIELFAVASTSIERAEEFKERFHFRKAFGNYESMIQDEEVDLVYIATPHSHHYQHMLLCLNHNKAIICEKAFCLKSEDAKHIFSLSAQKGVFVMEALVPAFLPSTSLINEILDTNIIGDVKEVYACFGADLRHVERVVKKELGGGAMYDIGIYPLFFFLNHFGFDSKVIDKKVVYQQDVDVEVQITLKSSTNIIGKIETTIEKNSGLFGQITGAKGIIYIENIARPEWIEIRDLDGIVVKRYGQLRTTTGYEYEFQGAARSIMNHQIETKEIPHSHSIALLQMIEDIIRK